MRTHLFVRMNAEVKKIIASLKLGPDVFAEVDVDYSCCRMLIFTELIHFYKQILEIFVLFSHT
jgi:hypothetical protein